MAVSPAQRVQRNEGITEMSTESLLDINQAADRLGTKPRFIRRLVAERRIPFYKIGRYVRIDIKDLDVFIEASLKQGV